MITYNAMIAPMLPSASRSCARCGNRFSAFGRQYICPGCRKPKARPQRQAGRHLTLREEQIVHLVRQAKTNKEIAWELCLTEGTVKEYLHHIFRKLKVTNRTELAIHQRATHEAPSLRVDECRP
jgi:DNA-binding NarL/FixJ family response regulator